MPEHGIARRRRTGAIGLCILATATGCAVGAPAVPNPTTAARPTPPPVADAMVSIPAGATPDGVQDLAGNLYEWTSSLDRPYPYVADDGREGRDSLDWRIVKGGRHDEGARALRAADRDGYSRDPFAGHHHIGFRCATDAP